MSWNTAEVRFIDRDQVIADLRHAVAAARAKFPKITRVFLFGSLVDGTWTADSDADLIVVVRKDFRDFFEGCQYQIYSDTIPVESLVYSENDFQRLAADPSSFVAHNIASALEL